MENKEEIRGVVLRAHWWGSEIHPSCMYEIHCDGKILTRYYNREVGGEFNWGLRETVGMRVGGECMDITSYLPEQTGLITEDLHSKAREEALNLSRWLQLPFREAEVEDHRSRIPTRKI